MERFKEIVINLANSKRSTPLTPSQIAQIENGIHNTFANRKTPTHPTYASMIEEAVKKLVEEGSVITEKNISEYITKNYEGLPWAHDTYLKHHLVKACERGELIRDVDGSYITSDQIKRESLRKEPCEQNDGSNRALDQKVRRSSRKKTCEPKYDIDPSVRDADQKVRRSLREKRHEVNYDTDGSDCVPEQKDRRSLRRKPRERNNDTDGTNCPPAQKEQKSLRKKLPEIIYDVAGSDSTGDQNELKSSRRKRLKRKSLDNRKEDVIEGNLAQEEVNELSDNRVGLPVGAPEEFGRGKRKQKRKQIYDEEEEEDEEEDEAVQTRAVVGEGNLDSGNAMVVIETQNEMLLPKGGKVECKSSETKNKDNGHVDIIAERKSNPQLGVECSKEVKNQVIKLDDHISEGTKELLLSALPENVESVSESDIARDHHQNCTGDLVLAPVALVSNIESDATMSMRKPNLCTSELMIVPYVDNSVNSDGGEQIIPLSKCIEPIIVCGLLNDKTEQLEKKLNVCSQRRKRSKLPKEKTEVQGEEQILASLDLSVKKSLETKLKRKSKSPKLKGKNLLEDTTVKHLERRMSSHAFSLDIISIEDEEPLSQVIEKSGNLKKHGMQGEMSKVASAPVSSKAGAPPEELPSSENFVEMTPTVRKESASTKITDKQLHMQAWSDEETCDYVKDETSRKSSSRFFQEYVPDGSSQRLNEGSKFQCAQKCLEPKESTAHHQQEEGPSESTGHGASDNQHSEHEKSHMKDSEGQSLPEVRHQDLQPPEIPVLDQDPQHKKRQRGRPRKKDELPPKNIKTGKPTLKVVADGQVRTRNQKDIKKDVADLLVPNLNEEEQHLQNQNRPLGKSGRGRRKKSKETAPPEPMDLYSKLMEEQQGSGTATGEHLDQPIRHLNENKASVLNLHPKQEMSKPATRMRIKSNDIKDRLAAPLKLDHQQEVGLSEPVNNQQSQITKPKRGRPKMQKEGDKDGEAITTFSHQEQDGMHPSQNSQDRNNKRAESLEEIATKSGAAPSNSQCPEQGDLKSSSHAIPEASATQSQIDLKDKAAAIISEASTCLADQSSQRQKDHNQPTRRITRSLEAGRFLVSQGGKQHDQELSDQRRLAKPALAQSHNHCPDKESDQEKQQKWYDDDQALMKMEVQVKPCKEMSSKSSSIQIPEASSRQSQIDFRESIQATSDYPDVEPSEMPIFDVSKCQADQSRLKDQHKPSRRVTRSSEAAKISESQNGKQHNQELSDQRRLLKPMLALTPLNHHCLDQESENQEQQEKIYDHDQAREEKEVQLKLRKDMLAKSTSLQVPLSSKHQLRSRMKRQSQ